MPSTAWSSAASSKTMLAALPPSSRVSALSEPATARRICLPDRGRAGERDLVDAGAADEVHPDLGRAGDDVDDAGRQVGLAADVGEEERRERRRGGGLEDDRVARREGRRDLPGEHQQREVPGDDLGGDAERPGDAPREGVLELVRPARVVPEVRRHERHVDVAALLDRLARVHRLEDGELAAALLEDPRDPEEVLGPLAARAACPSCAAGRVARRGSPDRRPPAWPARRRPASPRSRDRRSRRRPVGRLDLAAADEQPVALLERDDVARFRRGRVLPRDRLAVAEAPAGRGAIPAPGPHLRCVAGHARHHTRDARRIRRHAWTGRRPPPTWVDRDDRHRGRGPRGRRR